MYVAMNRFKVAKGNEAEFEDLWSSRQSYLNDVPGFIEFALLKGPEREEYTLYASHSVWASQDDFTRWTTSEAFRRAHANAGRNKPLSIGHPEFEGFTAVLVEAKTGARPAAE
jgi:heme-degrading monooxygenase HmoA